MPKRLSKDWSGYTLMDGIGKVTVQIRNGYLSTGYDYVTKTLPPFLRCYETAVGGKTVRKWVGGVSETPISELDDKYANAVVQYYYGKNREAKRIEAQADGIPPSRASETLKVRSTSSRSSVRA